jgi:hypothetical protein
LLVEPFDIQQALDRPVAATGGASTVAGLGPIRGYERFTLFAEIVGQAGATVVFSAEVSEDGDTWFTVPVVDLTGASKDALVASVTVAANGVTVRKAILQLAAEAPYVRITMAGGGAGTAVVSLTGVAKL